jgi:hypothetical protein
MNSQNYFSRFILEDDARGGGRVKKEILSLLNIA